jgi:hypothetical protein
MALIALLLATLLATQSPDQSHVKPPSRSLTISAAQSTVKAGSEVKLKIVVTNTSDHRISVPMTLQNHAEFAYLIEVQDSGGNQAPKTKYHRALRGEKSDNEPIDSIKRNGYPVYLQPGETAEDRVIVDKLYDLTQPGKYNIRVKGKDPESNALIESNTITVTVTP